MPRDDASVEAVSADDTSVPVKLGEPVDHVLSPYETMGETSDKVFKKSEDGTAPSSKHDCAVSDGNDAWAKAAGVHNVAPLVQVCEMASGSSLVLGVAVAIGAQLITRLGSGTALPRYESGPACDGAAAQTWGAQTAITTARTDASERL